MRPTVLALALAITAPAAAQEGAARALLNDARCGDAAWRQLQSWGVVVDRTLADPPAPDGTRAVRIPTGALGVWVQVAVSPAGDARLERVSAQRRESRQFGPGCEPLVTVESTPSRPHEHGFTDAALASRLARRDAGVILVWSPHMPLSVDQYEVLASVTRDMGLALVAVLDPAADPGYARRLAAERGFPEEALRPLDGIELAFRGMTTHAPSVQVFSGGRLAGPVLYGYRAAETARLAIRGVLDGLRPIRPPN